MGSGVLPLAMATRPARPPFGVSLPEDEERVDRVRSVFEELPAASRRLSDPCRWARVPKRVYRAISTGRLHGLLRFHPRPINVVVYHGSQRDLVLRKVSRLDAFSGYLVRT